MKHEIKQRPLFSCGGMAKVLGEIKNDIKAMPFDFFNQFLEKHNYFKRSGNHLRRLSKDYEISTKTAENFVMIAHSMILLKRLD